MNLIHVFDVWDTHLFLFLNSFHNNFFDSFMFVFSAKQTWIPLYIAVLLTVIKCWKNQSFWIILALVLCVVLADQISSGIIKNLVERPRPSHVSKLNGVIHLVNGYRSGQYGFVSSHSANAFGFAMLSSLLFKNRLYTVAIFLWAGITAYSRIYLGVHYPFDVLGGALVGLLSAFTFYFFLKKHKPQIQLSNLNINYSNINIPVLVLLISLLAICTFSSLSLINS